MKLDDALSVDKMITGTPSTNASRYNNMEKLIHFDSENSDGIFLA